MMKKIMAMVLVLTMVLSMSVVTASADSFDFGKVTVNLGRKFVFEEAVTGYGMMVGGVKTADGGGGDINPEQFSIFEVIIVKDGSRFTVDGSYNANCTFIAHEVEGRENGAVMFNKETQQYHTVNNGRVDDMFNSSGLSAVEGIWFVGDGMHSSPYWIVLESQWLQFPMMITDFGEEPVQESLFQSTAKVTEVGLADMNYNNFTVTVTNDTDCDDTSLFALMVVSDIVTITPFVSEVPAHSSRNYELTVVDHFGGGNGCHKIIMDPSELVDMIVVKFDSVDEYYEFFESVPVEQVSYLSAINAEYDALQLCDGTPGNQWLKSVGLSRKAKPFVYPSDDHSICTTLDLR